MGCGCLNHKAKCPPQKVSFNNTSHQLFEVSSYDSVQRTCKKRKAMRTTDMDNLKGADAKDGKSIHL